MRILTLTCFLCLVGNLCVVAQPQGFSKTLLDSLEKRLTTLPNDTNRISTLAKIAVLYSNMNVEKSILIGEEALKLTRKLNFANGFRKILGPLSFQYSISGQWAKGLELALEGKERYKDDLYMLGNYINLAELAYEKQGDYKRCLEECHENIRMFNNHPKFKFNPVHKWAAYMTASLMYSKNQQADSALVYAYKCLSYAQSIKFNIGHYVGYAHNVIGIGYLTQNKPDSAIAHLQFMLANTAKTNNEFALQETQIYLANAMQKKGALDSMYYYAKTAYDGAIEMGNDLNEMNAALILSEYFEKSNPGKSLFYLKRHNAIKEQLFTQDQTNKRYFLESEQRNKLAELEKKELNTKNRIRQNALLGGLFTFILLAGGLIYTNRRKKLLNDKLQEQKLQIEKQNQDLTNSGRELALKNRDLEIEGALEKVRSRSLVMQHSDEIQEVAYTLYNELKNLKFQFGACSVYLIDGDDNIESWVAGFNAGEFPLKLFVPKFNHPLYAQQIEAFHEGKNFETLYLTPDIKQAYDDQMFLHTDYVKLKLELIQMMRGLESAVFSLAYNKYGALHWGPGELTEEEKSILLKFSLVFEQAYTRYLDIKKAEAQADQARLNLIQIQTEKKRAEDALADLRTTQAQLIQSEKLASLGELTAGIAHEIQNPLNFVNNFAEVSAEMLDEMHEELEKGDTTEAIAIATDLKINLEKINHHGQRASSIVKGMLEHSRASSGVKEPIDLNALVDEFLRLAYHGLRAKDSSFNATMETHFDPDLPLVSVIPQDIGRVLLNLINNAFYAVAERSRSTVAERSRSAVQQRASVGVTRSHTDTLYQPTVTISTQKTADQIIIKVQDNGNGIPEAIREKIFQPFFTTKPTGQGTGLGLSLAYDIVTKGHGGELKVENIPEQGAIFTICLPIAQ